MLASGGIFLQIHERASLAGNNGVGVNFLISRGADGKFVGSFAPSLYSLWGNDVFSFDRGEVSGNGMVFIA